MHPGGLRTVRTGYAHPPSACCAYQRHRAACSRGAKHGTHAVRVPAPVVSHIALRTTYGVPHRGSSGEARLKVYAGSRGGRAEATGGHVFELQRLQRALMQVGLAGSSVSLILTYLLIRLVVAGMVYARGNSPTH